MEPSILLLKEIAVAANEARDMDVAFQTALERICALADWPVGHVYLPGADGAHLEPTEIWYLKDGSRFAEFRKVTETTNFEIGEGLPGRVWQKRQAVWVEEIPTASDFPRAAVAESVGLRGAFGVPILVGDEVAAVMEFFTVEATPRDDELLETLAQAGVQLGRVVERERSAQLLLKVQEQLERRVADRTAALTALNESLKVELVKHEKMEAALRDSEAMYHSLVEHAPLSIYRKNLQGRVVFGNASYCQGLGMELAELRGLTDFDLFDEEQASKYVADDAGVISSGTPLRQVERHQGRGGETLYVEVLKTPIYDHRGQCVGTQGIFWDVTAEYESRRKLEESAAALRQSNEDLAQFAYVASHDLQEPLRMVSSYLQLIEMRYRDVLDEPGKEFIAFAVDGAKRMKNLISALLEYSRVGTGELEMEVVPLGEIIEEVLDVLSIAIQEAGAAVNVGELPDLRCDRIQIAQLFQNLLGNAIKFCRDRVPKIDIYAEREEDDGAWRISVRDNGIGIEEAYLEKVFVIFQRLHSREDYAGTGIGLAICKRIVERHHGRFRVESEPGKGTTFSVVFPD